MSKNINVNPDHYKVGGRERQGEDVGPQPSMNERESKGRKREGDANYIPGAAPVGVSGKDYKAKQKKG